MRVFLNESSVISTRLQNIDQAPEEAEEGIVFFNTVATVCRTKAIDASRSHAILGFFSLLN